MSHQKIQLIELIYDLCNKNEKNETTSSHDQIPELNSWWRNNFVNKELDKIPFPHTSKTTEYSLFWYIFHKELYNFRGSSGKHFFGVSNGPMTLQQKMKKKPLKKGWKKDKSTRPTESTRKPTELDKRE